MPKKVAVDNLTMGIEEGECFGFLGPNGYHNFTTLSTNFSFSQNEQNIF
jgi:ABC-type multidrug transport system ATPase subunit